MIKIIDLDHFESIKKAQKNVGPYSNYLNDVLKPAIERGNWDEFENLDIGFTVTGESMGKIGSNDAWKNLQYFFDPNAKVTKTLDFTLGGSVIERNLRNQLKALALKMMWLSPRDYSLTSILNTINNLKYTIPPLLHEGCNSFKYIDFDLLESWVLTGTSNINFERVGIYNGLNKLFKEALGLPFEVGINKILNASDFGLTLIEPVQYNVIPQRLYYLGLIKSEEQINKFYLLRNELGKLSDYIANYFDKLYQGYARYLTSNDSKLVNGKIRWYLSTQNKCSKEKTPAFKEAFLAITLPNESQIIELLKTHRVEIGTQYIHKFHHDLNLIIGDREIVNLKGAKSFFQELNGGCLWGLMSRTGMRADEVYHLHTTKGVTTEIISKQIIYIIHADLSKTVKGSQSKQDQFVTTEVGKKAYDILQALHEPLRKEQLESNNFFHKIIGDFTSIKTKNLSKHPLAWFHKVIGNELVLTKEDLIDLKISDPNLSFNIGENYYFTGHQLRRSFAYYLIGYELLSFPQLKQQFSHVSLAMTRHYAKNASKFQKLRRKKENLIYAIDQERIDQKAQVYLTIFKKLANNERVAGGKGKGKDFAKNMMKAEHNLFKDKVDNDMLSLNYWKKQIRDQKRHIHAVAPGVYCTSTGCSLRTQVNLMECVDCKNDYIVDAVFAEAKRKEAEIHMLWDIENDELTPQTASEAYIKITAAERIMTDLDIEYEPVVLPKPVQDLLIPYTGVIV
ncbi:site-specific integrase [Colwellia sp. MB3u-55]|uniref:site-specific integrase n=1 Tax=Colwellia sp. MB3u-55 TaxID=2759810 RepID=UPI0015F40CD8|nr:site-specific integrase [Colwellia sp. MB3u-55]MBA6253139.1 site-specific integrase [Colwellia sp. MB3u-55]